MQTKGRYAGIVLGFLLSGAHASAQQPLSAIEWLNENPPSTAVALPAEPPIAQSAAQPEISVAPLEGSANRAIGLVPASVTGLPPTLWNQSETRVLIRLISDLPVEELPAMQSLLYKLLLAEADQDPDAPATQTLLLARIDKLVELGAQDAAQALMEQVGPERSKALFGRWFDVTLLTGDEDRACAVMNRAPHLAPDYGARIFCAVRAGDWQNATLMLDTAHALSLLDPHSEALLERFVELEAFEDAPPLRLSGPVTPLVFRLHEAIGEPLNAASLPRTFASADLREVAGWKAQLEAAERLSRSGALPANRLLGIYTDRLPAASGGIWDRVEALQRFDTALNSKSPTAVSKTLEPAWRAMQSAGLDVSFAHLFAADLADIPLTGQAMELAYEIALLSPDYERAAQLYNPRSDRMTFLTGLAKGDLTGFRPPNPTAAAISDAFGPDPAPQNLVDLAANGQLGEAILRAMRLFDDGSRGDLNSLTQSLAALRAFGLEDVARRASLQLLLRSPEA
jgi:hypothetical protein